MENDDINVLALVKGEERYVFLYDDERKSEAMRTLGRFASNPELSFSWYDAAVLSQRIRQTAAAELAKPKPTLTPQPELNSLRGSIMGSFEEDLFPVSANGKFEPPTLDFKLPLKWDPEFGDGQTDAA